jgi:hypothetical protein
MAKIPKTLTIPEKIVWCFEHRAKEAHIDVICRWVGITREEFHVCIGEARTLKVAKDFRLTAVYVRPGWWTCRPTQTIIARYEEESIRRNLTEQQRNAKVYKGTKITPMVETLGHVLAGTFQSWLTTHRAEARSKAADYVVEGIDEAVKKGALHVV